MIIAYFSVTLPVRYFHVHRNQMLDQTKKVRFHHTKELFVRTIIGAGIGYAISYFLMGPASTDPMSETQAQMHN